MGWGDFPWASTVFETPQQRFGSVAHVEIFVVEGMINDKIVRVIIYTVKMLRVNK